MRCNEEAVKTKVNTFNNKLMVGGAFGFRGADSTPKPMAEESSHRSEHKRLECHFDNREEGNEEQHDWKYADAQSAHQHAPTIPAMAALDGFADRFTHSAAMPKRMGCIARPATPCTPIPLSQNAATTAAMRVDVISMV